MIATRSKRSSVGNSVTGAFGALDIAHPSHGGERVATAIAGQPSKNCPDASWRLSDDLTASPPAGAHGPGDGKPLSGAAARRFR